ncbi:probable disease resistance protein At1g58602 [Corylus avellana]|uniref:probable disease resistance protein At1g58602 n=1 Tax=Corylus avellana TaxID=13451 RepID=UPI00286A9BE2|nr:probable disease resistance protein At1g58602 [Corylus avellana]
MADSVVTFLLQYLPRLLAEEANLLRGVKGEVDSIHLELNLINIFLQNSSEGKRKEHGIVKEVVRQIRDAAYEAEDVIDTFILNAAEQRMRNRIWKLLHCFNDIKTFHVVANKIQGINKQINQIFDNFNKYGIDRAETSGDAAAEDQLRRRRREAEEQLRRRRRDVEDNDVVGFDGGSDKLVRQLIEGSSKLDVFSIIGMGGLGKTTLARKIYNNDHIKSHFPYRAWVNVSQDFNPIELLLEILQSQMSKPDRDELTETLEDMSKDELKMEYVVKKLFEYLQAKERPFLIVMDDIWETKVWDVIRSAFPDNLNGSRILITSRVREVALHASPKDPYFLPFLDKDDSWKLFRKKVFRGEECSHELELMGRRIVEGCGGLPLEIVVLGGVLANQEKTLRIWSNVIGDVNWYLNTEKTKICKDILALSYTHLSRHLKPCFLYFGVFPEDFEISVRRLVRLWIAEGFIQNTGRRRMEDVAEDYLEELIDLSLIQVASREENGRVKTCRIHDLLRDLCISESAEEKFLGVLTDDNLLSANKSRRLSIQGNSSDMYISSNPFDSACTRSLFCFDRGESDEFNGKHKKWIEENFKLLKVLDLEGVKLPKLPKNLGKMYHLRYLGLRRTYLRTLPPFVGKLPYLETLDLRETELRSLPNSVWKMKHLRHLHLNYSIHMPVGKDSICLTRLQTLCGIIVDKKSQVKNGLDRSINLRKLDLEFRLDSVDELIECFASLKGLESLSLSSKNRDGRVSKLELKPLSSLENLTDLYLNGNLPALQNDYFPHSIIVLTLWETKLENDPMPILAKLPNLSVLWLLSHSYTGKEMVSPSGGFPKLRILKLLGLWDLETWTVEEGAMPDLNELDIGFCHKLKELQDQSSNVWASTKVVLMNMPNEFVENVKAKHPSSLIII